MKGKASSWSMSACSRRRVQVAFVVAIAVALGTGCGGAGEESDADDRSQIERALAIVHAGVFDGEAAEACGAMTDRAQREFSQLVSPGAQCAEAMEAVYAMEREGKPGDPRARIVSIEVDGDRATAVVKTPTEAQSSRAQFVREGGEWKVAGGFLPTD